jgi:hypothetical protein
MISSRTLIVGHLLMTYDRDNVETGVRSGGMFGAISAGECFF